MDEAPEDMEMPRGLKLLKGLVIALMVTMIAGLVTLVALIVIRFPVAQAPAQLPEAITLPDGARAAAFTQGRDWYAVVTEADEILVFDRETGEIRQRIRLKTQ
ncbi:hypothetical protein DDZ14_05680 [Maritimibacter sp. 55A14]|uniref:DUF6476 family protein n=1 Tax=Maritimibacter sp. 55A14 TaxID=2174844 RepID=UPI000D617737|nr:DUF6476 family protein [Maritimibacter sp. 55A14]PWE33277.1 hypothetical protein DDZ14_05680 [Maritimibacter sp. 55A14]